jgi:D-aminopeptidase
MTQAKAVKQGIGRQHARCIHPERAHADIRAAASRAIGLIAKIAPYRLETPITVRLEFYRSDMADNVARRLGTRRIDARSVERVVHDVRHILSF